MATLNFFLKEPDKKQECRIVMVYRRNGFRLTYNTGLKTQKDFWTAEQRIRLPKGHTLAENESNAILDGLVGTIKEIERLELLQKRVLSPESFQRMFFENIGRANKSNDIYGVIDRLVSSSKSTKCAGTINHYTTTKNKLLKFEEETGHRVSFETLDNSFYERFVDFLINKENLLNNTVGHHIKIIKTLYNYALKNDWIKENKAVKSFKVFSENVECIYLTDEELRKLAELEDLPENLDEVRDNFCFACYTGLRFSDVAKLNNSNLKGDYLEIRTEKTKDILQIPLSNGAQKILEKHKGKHEGRPLPKCITNQKTNEYLKRLCKKAEINAEVELVKYRGATKIRIVRPKHDLVCTHTARRTFITLSLEKGVRPEVVMEITGHKDYRIFKRYVKITNKVKIIELTQAWNKPILKVI